MTRSWQPYRQTPRRTSDMPSSQNHETLNIRALRKIIDQEISKGIQCIKQSAATRMSLSDTAISMVLGLDVQILTPYCDEAMGRGMLELAKTTPVLLTYAAGQERQEALQAIWQLQTRAQDVSDPIARSFREQPATIQKHFLTTKVKEMPFGPRGYAMVDYIPCAVVPLVDYWPDFVREAFASGVWRFATGDADGCGGVVLEIMEGRLDLIEWLVEMEEKRKLVLEDSVAGPLDRIRGDVWPIASTSLERSYLTEMSKECVMTEAAQMMRVLEI